jgi:hypothetical protein
MSDCLSGGTLRFGDWVARRMTMPGLGRSLGPRALTRSAASVARIAVRPIGQRELLLWLAVVLLLNQLFWEAAQTSAPVIEAFAGVLASKSVFFYVGWYAVFRLLYESASEPPASALALTVGLTVCMINFLPARSTTGIAATILAGYLLATTSRDEKLKGAAAVLLGLAFNSAWGPKLLELFAYYVVRIDAALVGSALMLTWPDVVWSENVVGMKDGHSIIIYSSCASLQNISLGLLCWVSIKSLVRTHWLRSDFWIALAVCSVVTVLNINRLYLAALSPEHYSYWHGGFGEEIFLWLMTAIVLALSLWGVLRVGRTS